MMMAMVTMLVMMAMGGDVHDDDGCDDDDCDGGKNVSIYMELY